MDIKILAGSALLAGFIIYNNEKKKSVVNPDKILKKNENMPMLELRTVDNIPKTRFKTYELSKLGRSEQQAIFQDHPSKKALIVKKAAIITIAVAGSVVSIAALVGYLINSFGIEAKQTSQYQSLKFGNKDLGEDLLNKGIDDIEKVDTTIKKEDIDIEVGENEKEEIAEKLGDNAKSIKERVLEFLRNLKDKFVNKFKDIKKGLKNYWFSDKDVKVATSEKFESGLEEETNLNIKPPMSGFVSEIDFNKVKLDLQNLQQEVKDNALVVKTELKGIIQDVEKFEESAMTVLKSNIETLKEIKQEVSGQSMVIEKQETDIENIQETIETFDTDIENLKKTTKKLIESEKEIKTEVEKQGISFEELKKKNFIPIN